MDIPQSVWYNINKNNFMVKLEEKEKESKRHDRELTRLNTFIKLIEQHKEKFKVGDIVRCNTYETTTEWSNHPEFISWEYQKK